MGSIEFTSPQYTSYLGYAVLLGLGLLVLSVVQRGISGLTRNTIKLVLVLILIAVLGEPYLAKEERSSKAILLLDVSDSMDESVAESLLTEVKDISASGVDIEYLPFSKKAGTVALPLLTSGTYRAIKSAWSSLDIGGTDIEQAVLEASRFGEASILLLSDGYENSGKLDLEGKGAVKFESRIFPIAPTGKSAGQNQFRISNLHAPLLAAAERSVDVRVSISNSLEESQTGTLRVVHAGKLIKEEEVLVPAGSEILVIAESDPLSDGIKEVTATLTPHASALSTSSQTVYLSTKEKEKVLLLSGTRDDEEFLKQVLTKQAYRLDARVPSDPSLIPEFSSFSAVILNNIPAGRIGVQKLSNLEKFVSQGGGLLMIGGDQSFGLGGYRGTVIEEALPVRLVPPQTVKKRLNVAVELVMDKSRSMNFGNKIEYAKEAAREVIRNLKDEDFVGVIGFDTTPYVAVPIMQLRENRDFALGRVGTIFPTGKTNLFPAMDEGRRSLVPVKAGRKHMIVMTDGKIPDAGPYYIDLVKSLRLDGVTVSTVMMGSEADVKLLQDMAEVGGGSFYQTSDARNLPRIFLSDIKVSTGERSLKESSEFLVKPRSRTMLITTLSNYPPVRGYVQTRPKERAHLELVAIEAGRAEPLLATWTYGKGKSVAFTSDANGRWSNYWIRWQKFSQFWSDVLDSVRPESKSATDDQVEFDLRYFLEGGKLSLDLSVYSEDLSGNLEAQLLFPDGSTKDIEFEQVSRGRYFTEQADVTAGKYELRVKVGERTLTPVALSLSGELFGERKGRGYDLRQLGSWAAATGGKINPTAEDLKEQSYTRVTRTRLEPYLLALALFLFLLQILLREGFSRPRILRKKKQVRYA